MYGMNTKQLVYIANGATRILLSKKACQELGIISHDFPLIGAHKTYDVGTRSKLPDPPAGVNTIFSVGDEIAASDPRTHASVNIIQQENLDLDNNDSDPWTIVSPKRRRKRLQHQGWRTPGEGDRCHTKYASRGQLPTCADSAIYRQNSGQEDVAWF